MNIFFIIAWEGEKLNNMESKMPPAWLEHHLRLVALFSPKGFLEVVDKNFATKKDFRGEM